MEALWPRPMFGYLLCGGVHLLELGLAMVGGGESVVGGKNGLMHGPTW